MEIDLVLKNYRCFQQPVRITLRKGFTSLVGVNNSGKSSLLKFFYEFRNLFATLSNSPDVLSNALRAGGQGLALIGVQDYKEIFNNTNDRDVEIEFRFNIGNGLFETALSRLVITLYRRNVTWSAKLYYFENVFHTSEKLILFNVPSDPSTQSLAFETPTTLIYRGNTRLDFTDVFELFRSFSQTLYIGPFRNVINTGTNENYFDIKVGQAFIHNWKMFKTGSIKEQNQAIIQLTEDIERVFEYKRLEINASDDDTTLQLIINGKSYKLSELGSGITQFILVLANAAIKRPAFILLDEPELNLHPSLQLDFLTTLAAYASEGILFATHSIGLARASAERIYSFRRIAEGNSEVKPYEATPRLSQFVGELSFSGYKELGFDKILLVEGRSEVKTIQQFLRLWKKDHQILLLPLGGSQFINDSSEMELQEIKRISNNIFVLIDSEKDSVGAPLDAQRQAFVDICNNLQIDCHVLERRATENYFTDQAVKRAKGDNYRALTAYEKLKDISPAWSKSENWRIAREMTLDELEATDLGVFLKRV
jgi:ABC-type cobalamin/Fe3+-siderophores transport system ATPase subunit